MKKKIFPIIMAVVMVFAMLPLSAGTTYAAKNATNYEPKTGPYYDENEDGSRTYWAYITAGENAADDTWTSYDIFNSGMPLNEMEGAHYDEKSNTLTLKDFQYPGAQLYAYEMGDDFTIKVIGNCEIDTLEISGDVNEGAGENGAPLYWGGSLNLEGSGKLTINHKSGNEDNPWGLIIWGEGSESLLKISEHVSLEVHGYNSEPAIMIIRSAGFYSDQAITIGGKALSKVYSKYEVKGFENEAEPTLKDYWVASSNVNIKGDGKTDINKAAVVIKEQYIPYTGKAQNPTIVTIGGMKLKAGTDYTVPAASSKNVGKYSLTITGKGNYAGKTTVSYQIIPAGINETAITGITGKTYTGKAITQNPVVKLGGITLKNGTDYTIAYKNNTKIGTATMTITGKGNLSGTTSKTFKISQAANPLTAKAKAPAVKYKKLKKKNQTIAIKKAVTVKKAQGKVTYKKAKGSKKIKVDPKTGKITVKKGLKKGTYAVKIKVSAKGNENYKKGSKTVTVKIKVK